MVLRTWARTVRRLGAVLSLAVFGSMAALVLAELVLHWVPALMPPQAAMRAQLYKGLGTARTLPDAYIGFRLPPNSHGAMRSYDAACTFNTDSHGFRNTEPWPRQADIVAIGDSLTFGFGVRDGRSWVDLMARALDDRAIVNLSLPGLGPVQYLRLYEAYATSLRPKIVLVGFFPANDFWDTAKFLEWQTLPERGNYVLWRDFGVTSPSTESKVRKVLLRSYLYQLVWLVRNPDTEAYGRHAMPYDTRDGRLLLFPSALRKLRKEATPGHPGFDEAFRALKELDRRVRANGGRMVVIILPSKEYVYLPLMGASMPDDPLRHVYEALDDLHLTYVDTTPRFREHAAAGERLFFEVDGHPNDRGYAVIADTVTDYLRGRRFRALASLRVPLAVHPGER